MQNAKLKTRTACFVCGEPCATVFEGGRGITVQHETPRDIVLELAHFDCAVSKKMIWVSAGDEVIQLGQK